MAQFEVLEAHRELKDVSWVKTVESEARLIFGQGALDFRDGELARRGIVVFGHEEQRQMFQQHGLTGEFDTDEAEMLVMERMPLSFAQDIDPSVRKKPKVRDLGPPGKQERAIVVPVGFQGVLEDERAVMTGAANQAAGRRYPWRGVQTGVGIILATVETDGYIKNDGLKELAQTFPPAVQAVRGEVKRVPIEV